MHKIDASTFYAYTVLSIGEIRQKVTYKSGTCPQILASTSNRRTCMHFCMPMVASYVQ